MIQAREHLYDETIIVPILSFREKTSSLSTGLFAIAKGWTFPELAWEPHHPTCQTRTYSSKQFLLNAGEGGREVPPAAEELLALDSCGEKGQFSSVT